MVYNFIGKSSVRTSTLVLVLGVPAPWATVHAQVPDPPVRVIVRFAESPDRARLLVEATTLSLSLEARHELVVEGLRETHLQSMRAAAPVIEEAKAAGALIEIDRLWIANAIVAEIDPAWIARLIADPAIATVEPDGLLVLDAGTPAASGTTVPPTEELQRIRVPEVWAQGITGQGAIVANTDTGVNGEDDTLEDRWRGLVAGSEATWFAPNDLTVFPTDDDPVSRGHGTATMGIMTGGEQSFGVAYDATWIAGDVFRDARFTFEGYVSTALKVLQWAADPDGDPTTTSDVPDVVSNSYGLRLIESDTQQIRCDPVFNDAIDALEAAGAIVVWSAGNFGPEGVTTPANRATSAVNAFAVGAVDSSDEPLSSSGRGPSRCGGQFAIKPEVVAPGANVPSRTRFNADGTFSGTSFSTPMAAGVLALMRSKNPTITPEAAKAILLETARDLGVPGDDNATGRGLIDAAAAIAQVERPTQPLARLVGFRPASLAGGVAVDKGLAPAQAGTGLVLQPGATHDLVPLLTNHGPAIPATTATLSSPTPEVMVTRSTVTLAAATTGAFFGPESGGSFSVEIDPAVAPGSDLALVLSIQGALIGPFKMVFKAGDPIAGTFATHDRGRVRLSVTNFGGLGYYNGSHAGEFGLRGQGFRFPSDSPNWLFHASFMAGISADRVSDDIPYGEDAQNETDFFPVHDQPLVADEAAGAQRFVAIYDDRHAIRPLGIRVRQESYAFGETGLSDFIILQYIVTNTGTENLTGLRLGLFADWDLPGSEEEPAETAGWDPSNLLGFVQGASSQPALGVVWLDVSAPGLVTYAVLRRDSIGISGRRGLVPAEAFEGGEEFSDGEKWDALSSGQTRTTDTRPSDLWQVIGAGPSALAAGRSDTVAVAMVGAATLEELRVNAAAARDAYFRRILGIEPPPPPPPPEAVVLEQNFPNPFRHGQTTTILFAVPEVAGTAQPTIHLAVYDVAGRLVRTLVSGPVVPGEQGSAWDGRDDEGEAVPAGLYVVRLVAGGVVRSIRVLLVP
ncbi:MAG: S8 family serine peptidase [Gemmatimonadota bacterium]